MQIVIDIPEEKYMEYKRIGDSRDVLFEAIRKGTPLPKVHGRLKDVDKLESHEMYDFQGYTEVVYKDDIDDLLTIIEACNEVEE